MMCSGAAEGLLLIAFGLGYFVLYFAKKGDKGLQFLGYFVGTILLLLSLWLLMKTLFEVPDFMMNMPRMMHKGMGGMMKCPMMGMMR